MPKLMHQQTDKDMTIKVTSKCDKKTGQKTIFHTKNSNQKDTFSTNDNQPRQYGDSHDKKQIPDAK